MPDCGTGEEKRSVYLPQGTKWYDWNTTRCYEGGQKIQVEMPLDQIPVFVRAGSVIPLQEPGANTDEMKNKEITLCVYSGRDGYFRMYEDAGDGYGYEDGDYCITDISWQEKRQEAYMEEQWKFAVQRK